MSCWLPQVVGRCEETADVVGTGKVPQLVLDTRHADKGPLKSKHPAIQPERVMRYKYVIASFRVLLLLHMLCHARKKAR